MALPFTLKSILRQKKNDGNPNIRHGLIQAGSMVNIFAMIWSKHGEAAFSFRSPVTDHGGELGIERNQVVFWRECYFAFCIFGSLCVNLGCRAHSSSSACDFEFGLVFPGAEAADQGVGIDDAGRFSHADELFNYKGLLLPLHRSPSPPADGWEIVVRD